MKEKDPILEEFEFCPECEPKVLQLVEYVRNLENAQIVAKQALETISKANDKLTFERRQFVNKINRLEEKLSGKNVIDFKKKIEAIDNAYNKMINRDKLI